MKIITSKTTIPTETPRVSRRRLLDALQANLASCNATIINGRAGTGKTMLAADFARRCGQSYGPTMRNLAWYKVDAPDVSLSVFMEYLVASVARARPGFGSETLARQSRSAGEFNVSTLVEAYVYDLERQAEPLLLTLDDLHLIYDADWVVPFFHRLLPLLPADIHMLILGRGLPPAPLWRLRSKQRLFVVTEQMLAFTQQDAEDLFSSYGLGAEEAGFALKQTGGRAADLHAAAVRASAACLNEVVR
ncbi:MAG: AAA family ATPase [Blastocatellia bacterium]